jgi:hypothetical protein
MNKQPEMYKEYHAQEGHQEQVPTGIFKRRYAYVAQSSPNTEGVKMLQIFSNHAMTRNRICDSLRKI